MASGPDPGDRSRFAKLGMAINEELTQACRDVLEMEVPPGLVYNKVKSSSIYKKIRPEQELRLLGAKTDGYKEFDITLLYTLIRNICSKIPPPTKGWGGNKMPSVAETTIGDDIERIRMIRNNMSGHISSASIPQTDFDDTWSLITDICQRLQTYTKKNYMSGLSNIQSQALEEEYELTVIEKLREDYTINQCLRTENPLVKEILENWREDDVAFIPTRASEAVEEMLKSHHLITVVGNSGSGKSAIIQHIALIMKERGWNVTPVDKVEEIKKICSSEVTDRILFVFNDPLGKESLDEILYHSWKSLEKTLEICLKKNKLLISCRRCVFYDKRIKGILLDESNAVEIDNETNGLTVKEKKAIFNTYSQSLGLSQEVVSEIIKTEAYFPLLCKLFSREANYKETGVDFFKHPYKFVKKEIEVWKKTDKKRFCSLILLVAFKNKLKIESIDKNDMKFKDILGICELQENTHISVIRSTLQELRGSYIKRVGNIFQFLHDFIMEITILVFGVDCPQETIQYADSGFLRRRMRIEDDTEEGDRDPFTVYLPEEYIGDLVDRFINDMQTEHLVDVILNPCLREKSVIKSFKEKVNSVGNLLVKIKCEKDNSEFVKPIEKAFFSRLDFLFLQDEICPLVGLIVLCHNEISSFFLKDIPETKLMEYPIFSALCANGDLSLMNYLSDEYKRAGMMETWGKMLPIEIASIFHNFLIIGELVKLGADLSKVMTNGWSALILAALNEEGGLKEVGIKTETSEVERRNATIICLLKNGADINLSNNHKVSPLYVACQNGHDSTVQLLLNNGADINLCDNDGASPLYTACHNGHDSTVQLLLNKGADINFCDKNGVSPLHIACQNGYDNTVQLLLNNGADINLCNKNGVSPLYIACHKGHDSTVQLLLNNGADINLCDYDGDSPLYTCIACENGHDSTVQLLLNKGADINFCDKNGVSPLHIACQNGYDNTVQLLLNNGADINLCNKNGVSPLYIACHKGHDSTVQLLLNNGADINLCDYDGASPLYTCIACENGHDSTVQLLLNNGAAINLCNKNGVSPLHIACLKGHDSTVQLLLNNGADINLCGNIGVSPLYLACHNGHGSTVQLLLNNGADINLCGNIGVSPLYLACHKGHGSTVQLLLNNGADINSCDKNGDSPLYIACENGNDSTVQMLLNNGADINLCDNDGDSPLYIACQNGHDSTVQLLLNNGADINLCDNDGDSPLYIACENGHDSTVQMLLNNGAEVNLCNKIGVSPLHIACLKGHDSTVQLLLNNSADINFCV
ncbi:uncharacterized protein LOC134247559 [Saccostrea cucullata]|uniref:uncharacterized protein LOC134247559 n=1 Tax=Saccostrea cuccullata TaxID=36930 RepID=UPI002ED44B7D